MLWKDKTQVSNNVFIYRTWIGDLQTLELGHVLRG